MCSVASCPVGGQRSYGAGDADVWLIKIVEGETWTVYNRDNSGLPYDDVRALAIDAQGNIWIGSGVDGLAVYREGAAVITDVEQELSTKLPSAFSLSQNYPNPFNAGTLIRYALPAPADVTIRVYNLSGQLVRTLVHKRVEVGCHTIRWDGNDATGREAASGVYLYWVVANGNHLTKKMLLLR